MSTTSMELEVCVPVCIIFHFLHHADTQTVCTRKCDRFSFDMANCKFDVNRDFDSTRFHVLSSVKFLFVETLAKQIIFVSNLE